ncbi:MULTISPECIES: hypothetical protein [unclassified Pseudoclavibacter]|uniref:hypothetical protein n=1 Tax=unclassified Pseudoclavibacter TaxID=2615177 RepID=UPI001BA9CE04|nr:hypothetical protein [Pseudoclavibacter sp. Marseille-Q4354]MBS3177756.1 hypothetical protein [Pseudoclavibacter sp. Marseille-Q4354]
MSTVGRVQIRTTPDTAGFSTSLRRFLLKVEKAARVNVAVVADFTKAEDGLRRFVAEGSRQAIEVGAEIDEAELARSARRASESAQKETARRPVRVPVSADEKVFRRSVDRDLTRALSDFEALVPATVDGEKMRREVAGLAEQIETQSRLEIPAGVEDAAKFRREISELIDQVTARTAHLRVAADTRDAAEQIDDIIDAEHEATVQAEADTLAAEAQLAVASRRRLVSLVVRVNQASLATAATAIARLSGARVLSNTFENIGRSLSNMDKNLPSIALLATAITGLSAAAFSSLGGLLAIAGGIASIAGAALLLPGILAGVIVSAIALGVAFADAGAQLESLAPAMTGLREIISGRFWEQARQPILDMVNSLLPQLESGFGRVSTQLGAFTGDFAAALQSFMGGGVLEFMFAGLATGIENARAGASAMAEAITTLGFVGAEYMPALGTWISDIANQFNNWLQGADADGQLRTWIDTGITALQDLGSVIASTSSILAGLVRAANDAEFGGLAGLAVGLRGIAEVVNSPGFQTGLTTVFAGAKAGIDALGPGVSAAGGTLAQLAGTIATVFTQAGGILSTALQGIATALAQPAFATGLTAFFAGIQTGISALLPMMPAIGDAFGALLSVAGTLVSQLGPLLGAALGGLAPVLTEVLTALGPVIEVLGSALTGAVGQLIPPIASLVSALLPPLAALLVTVAQAVGPLLSALMPLVEAALVPIASVLGVLAPLFAQLGPILGMVAGFIAQLATALTPVLAALAGVLAPVLSLLSPLLGLVAALLEPILGLFVLLLQPVLGLATNLVSLLVPALTFVADVLAAVVTGITEAIKWFTDLVSGGGSSAADLTSVWQTVSDFFSGLWAGIATIFTDAWASLSSTVSAGWSAISSFFTDAWTSISSVVQAGWDYVAGIFSSAFAVVQAVVQTAWSVISTIFTTAWAIIQQIVAAAILVVVSLFSGNFAAIGEIVTVAWTNIQALFGQAAAFIMNILATAWATITTGVSTAWAWIVGFLTVTVLSIWDNIQRTFNNIVFAIEGAWARAQGFVATGVAAIKQFIVDGFNAAVAWVTSTMSQMASGVETGINNMVTWFTNLPTTIQTALADAATWLVQVGKDIIAGLVGGITGAIDGAVSSVKDGIGSIIDGAKDILGIASPSRVFRFEVGKQISAGLALGISDGVPVVQHAFDDLMSRSPSVAGLTSTPRLPSFQSNSPLQSAAAGSSGPLVQVDVVARDYMSEAAIGHVAAADIEARLADLGVG